MMSMMTVRNVGAPKPFYNLVRIELLYCQSCQQLPAFGHLPCLSDLSMYSMWSVTSIGDEFYHSSNDVEVRAPTAFPVLRELNIFSFENLTKWEPPISPMLGKISTPVTTAFPLLEMLRIEECAKLVQTQTNFPSLRHLQVDKSLRGLALYNVLRDSSNALTSLNINEGEELSNLPDELINCMSLEIWNPGLLHYFASPLLIVQH
ncbi:putative disease resistance protein RGA1 [Bienertia sinuspersici]